MVVIKKITHILFWILLFIYVQCLPQKNQNPKNELSTTSFKNAGIDSIPIIKVAEKIVVEKLNIHSLLILRHNRLVYENYFAGEDQVFGVPIGHVNFKRDSLHDCRSLTKSVVSACFGIAIAQQKIKSINDKVISYLPGYERYDTGTKRDLTVKDLLTMSAGLEWNENIPYSDPTNSEIQMLNQKDVVDFVLSRPVVTLPGTVWNYSAGCTQLLSEILQRMTGEKIDSFANKNIFEPLGIKKFYWYERNDGTPWAASGLRLRPVDMAKFGMVYLNEGKWNDQQIIPGNWVKQSLTWQINARNTSTGYGYQFWCAKDSIGKHQVDIAMAIGYGGQRIYIIPSLELEIVMTAGNYNELSDLPDELISTFIFPAIKD